ncbi:sulfotransferase [Tautonia sp. JC769]|uniref:sulfotransferase family protein n=1 Tax=Tautonia sp. JC769 TaxID=3232135 RepID=UPI003457AD44
MPVAMQTEKMSRSPGGRLPNFLIIGATKCGTESLFRLLSDHPEVFMHPRKELRFFTEEHAWGNGPEWYRAQFSAAGDARAVGESSNSYTRDPVYRGAPKRIHQLLPDVRMIYVIRHPIKRIESHYRHRLVTGIEWRSPERAIREDPSYVAASLYGHQLEQYRRFFRPEQFLILRFEQLISEPLPSLRRICQFLGISEAPGVGFPRANVTSERTVAPAILRYFARFPAARDRVKSAVKSYGRSRFARFAPRASDPAFSLPQRIDDELRSTFRADREVLSRLVGEQFDEWDLNAGPLAGGMLPGRDEAGGVTRT